MQHTRFTAVPQGAIHVTSDPSDVLYTPLGSCISACMFDPVVRIGGMNHFLLPVSPGNDNRSNPAMFGIHAMPMLLDAMLRAGARPERIRAKLFGGSRNIFGGRDIGMLNRELAEDFLEDNGIRLLGGFMGSDGSMSISFRAAAGKVEGRRHERPRHAARRDQMARLAGLACMR